MINTVAYLKSLTYCDKLTQSRQLFRSTQSSNRMMIVLSIEEHADIIYNAARVLQGHINHTKEDNNRIFTNLKRYTVLRNLKYR